MAEQSADRHDTVGAWAKRYYLANRALIESVLRPYDLGSTQWYVLHQLANNGATMQRDLGRILHIERATLSGIVAALVRKGLVDQAPDVTDQRQRMLRLTESGARLWDELPDPIAVIQTVSVQGVDEADVATAIRVLRAATQHVNDRLSGGDAG